MKLLITGGAGYLGSHMAANCLEKSIEFVVIDNLSNSDLSNLQALESHLEKSFAKNQQGVYILKREISD